MPADCPSHSFGNSSVTSYLNLKAVCLLRTIFLLRVLSRGALLPVISKVLNLPGRQMTPPSSKGLGVI